MIKKASRDNSQKQICVNRCKVKICFSPIMVLILSLVMVVLSPAHAKAAYTPDDVYFTTHSTQLEYSQPQYYEILKIYHDSSFITYDSITVDKNAKTITITNIVYGDGGLGDVYLMNPERLEYWTVKFVGTNEVSFLHTHGLWNIELAPGAKLTTRREGLKVEHGYEEEVHDENFSSPNTLVGWNGRAILVNAKGTYKDNDTEKEIPSETLVTWQSTSDYLKKTEYPYAVLTSTTSGGNDAQSGSDTNPSNPTGDTDNSTNPAEGTDGSSKPSNSGVEKQSTIVKKVSSVKTKAKGNKKISVSWSQQKKAKKFEIQISSNKDFKKDVIVKKFSSKKKDATIKCKKKGTAYVRIRAIDKYGKVSPWSKVKKIVVK
ncbi:hypothetical protein [Butyrivibrio sp. MB2005]|uniref:hypothetical protein n=1 Tax=Butyrivibrio sp. MB2005 TaxID=1280678 RepID=UPI0004288F97|nr:hypothetical protein [Butyrivibrio sp. MB2005]